MPFANKKIGFIGSGAMAEALIKSVLRAGLVPAQNIMNSDVNRERGRYIASEYGINYAEDNTKLLPESDIVVYAVKPYIMDHVLAEVGALAHQGQLHISIAAGITLAQIEKHFSPGIPIVRAMPNTPCLIGEGASAFALGSAVTLEDEQMVKEIFDCTGVSVKVPENLINAVTGLSGSGPAYVFMILEALIDGGVKVGLPRETASLLAVQTVAGAAKMIQATKDHPGRLKDMVTTPGGTTIAGLHVLEQGKLRAVLMDAVIAAVQRADELGSKE